MSEMIMYDSDEAAKFKTGISGWVSSNGKFWGKDEHMARYSGCTHKTCECGNVHEKIWTVCEECRNKRAREKFEAMPFEEYNDQIVCYGEEYFFDEQAIIDFMEYENLQTLDLEICEPQYAPYIEEYGYDYFPEGVCDVSEIDPKLGELIGAVNVYIAKEKPILSWSPGKKRTRYALKDDVKND